PGATGGSSWLRTAWSTIGTRTRGAGRAIRSSSSRHEHSHGGRSRSGRHGFAPEGTGAVVTLVSVITPTYRHGALLGEAIRSLLAQTCTGWEQIILDDGSPDDTRDVAVAFKDERIRYVQRPHEGLGGVGRLYSSALEMARGELVAILEGDDV